MIVRLVKHTILLVLAVLFCGCHDAAPVAPDILSIDPIVWGTYEGSFGGECGEFHNPGGLAIGSNGSIYVADSYNRRVQVFDEAGLFLRQWRIDGIFQDIAIDSEGHLYVPVWAGYVIKFDIYGNEILRWGESGTGPGEFQSPTNIAIDQNAKRVFVMDVNNQNVQVFGYSGVFLERWGNRSGRDTAIDPEGNVFITEFGGSHIFKLSSTGVLLETWDLPAPDFGGISQPRGIVVESGGNVFVCDTATDRIYQLDSTGALVAFWGALGSAIGDLCFPSHLAIANDNTLYVSERYRNHRVQQFTPNGESLQVIGKAPPSCEAFIWPSYIAVSDDKAVYVTDSDHVKKFDIEGRLICCWGGLGSAEGQLYDPRGVAVYEDNVFVVDFRNHRIQVFDESGTLLRLWGRYGHADGEFRGPTGIAIDREGSVFVLDPGNSRVQRFDFNGNFIGAIGIRESAYGIIVDNNGGIYVTANFSDTVRKYDYEGQLLLEWGGEGSGDGEFDCPRGLSIGPDGSVYVVDFENCRVQKFDDEGNFIAKWGTRGSDLGELYRPQGVVCCGDFVIVADSNNRRVQRLHSSYWLPNNGEIEK